MYSELAEGHPIRTYLHETELIQNLLEEIMQTDPEKDYQKFYNLFNHLSTVEKRFQRKENQLFPFLEQKGGRTLHRICGHSTIPFAICSAWSERT